MFYNVLGLIPAHRLHFGTWQPVPGTARLPVSVGGTAVSHRFTLEPGEALLESWVAGLPHKGGRKVKWGGQLHLTERRLVWEVVRLSRKGIFRLTPEGLVLSAADAAVGAVLGSRSGTIVPLSEITAVRADEERGSILHVDTAEGSMRLLVTASKWGYNKRADAAARDGAVIRIREACGTAG
jgi:hypothetical protein